MSPLRVESGRLAFDYVGTAGLQGATISVPLCAGGGSATIQGYKFSANVWFMGGSLPSSYDFIYAYVETGTVEFLRPVPNTQLTMQGTFNTTQSTATVLAISFTLYEEWTGTVYIDNITVEP